MTEDNEFIFDLSWSMTTDINIAKQLQEFLPELSAEQTNKLAVIFGMMEDEQKSKCN